MSKNILDLFADVVVFAPTDPRKSFFTYKIPEKLSKDILTGQLASVPWGKKESLGIVVEIKKETKVLNPKLIKRIIFPTPLLLPNYIELLRWMSWYYVAPMLDCLKAMLPEINKQLQANRLQRTTEKIYRKPKAVSSKQSLTLVPNINQISTFLYEQKDSEGIDTNVSVPKGIAIYHKQLPRKELWKIWWQIYEAKISKVIGTRSALFVQFPNLGEIKIINEEDSGFKDVQSPYFDTLTVATKLAKITGAKLKIQSITPRIETYYSFPKKLIKTKLRFQPKITIVDLTKTRKAAQLLILSDSLRELMTQKVKHNKSILLFLNRIKESGQVYCFECKFSGYLPSLPNVCPNCQGSNFKFYSLNLKSVGKEILKIFPQIGLRIVTERKTINIAKGKPIVTLATSVIFSQKNLKFSLIGIISADTILNLPDFVSSFRTFSTLIKLSQLANNNGEVLIQTYNPQHSAIKCVAAYDFERFYQEELILRKKIELPPFATLAKLTIKFKNTQKALGEAERLKVLLEKKSLLVEVSDPVQNWQGKPEFNIIVKNKKREDLDAVLSHVPTRWKVVVDPESLL